MSPNENARPSADDRAPSADGPDAVPTPTGPECEICGMPMYDLHCKIVCPRCGYKRDCSDP